ncbi:zf-HC2 domain-containing protein [bacterium]|nr:zf-HC2 domain-containing protein [bacterium]
MKCTKVNENLVAYLDNELTPIIRIEVEKHLKNCSACVEEKNEIEKLLNISKRLVEIENTSNQIDSIMSKIKMEKDICNVEFIPFNWVRYSLSIAVAVIIVVLAVQLMISSKFDPNVELMQVSQILQENITGIEKITQNQNNADKRLVILTEEFKNIEFYVKKDLNNGRFDIIKFDGLTEKTIYSSKRNLSIQFNTIDKSRVDICIILNDDHVEKKFNKTMFFGNVAI